MKRALVAGHICLDLTPRLRSLPSLTPGALVDVGAMTLSPGGCVANTGGDLAALGAPVAVSADIGSDALATALEDLLAQKGLDTSGFRRTELATSYSIVVQAPGTDRVFWHHVGANAGFDGTGVDIGEADLLHVGYPSLLPALVAGGGMPLCALLSRASDAGLTTSLDLAVVDGEGRAQVDWRSILAAVLPVTDVITPSIDDLTSAFGSTIVPNAAGLLEAARDLIAKGAAIALVSAGTRGMALATASASRFARGGRVLSALDPSWHDRDEFVSVAAIDHPVTTTGAGDAATAGFLYALLTALSPERALQLAAATASRKVQGLPIGQLVS
jgi:sugar/nucleoside kinase (ribokinase family)